MSKIIKKIINKTKSKNEEFEKSYETVKDQLISNSIDEIKSLLKTTFNNSSDFVIREIRTRNNSRLIISYLDGLVNKELINRDIIKQLLDENKISSKNKGNELITYLTENILTSCDIGIISFFRECINSIINGETVIFIEGANKAIKTELKSWEKRGINEPSSNVVIRGPREGFTETMQDNITMVRRKIKNPNLVFESLTLGKQTNTNICICYIKGIVNDELINIVKNRINKIKIDAILESGYIEEFIQDSPYSIFSTVGNTERPDVVAGKILEGRIAILCDGTPFVLTAPYLFVESLQINEDYYNRYIYSIILRFLRILAVIITSLLPSFYIALLCFHQDVIPFSLLLSIAGARDGVPFSPFVETLLMLIVFELIKEAGVRMPRQIGQAVSIVGAIVIGDAAVKAGLVSAPLIIVVALTAICSYIVTDMSDTFLVIRFITMIAANIVGILGIVLVLIGIFIHMCSIKSFSIPYMWPFTPLNKEGMKDSLIRYPLFILNKRPKALTYKNSDSEYRGKKNWRGMN